MGETSHHSAICKPVNLNTRWPMCHTSGPTARFRLMGETESRFQHILADQADIAFWTPDKKDEALL